MSSGPAECPGALVLFRKQESEPRRGKGKGEYQPKHAAPGPRRGGRDTTNLWLWIVLLVTSGFVAGTTAAFSATTTDTGNSFGLASLSPPGVQTVTVDGTNLDLSVATLGSYDGGTAGTNVGARWRYYYPTGISQVGDEPTCDTASATYTEELGESSTSSKDNVAQPGAAGRWMCVMAFTTYPTPAPAGPAAQWLSQINNPRGETQGGMVISSVSLDNAGGNVARMQFEDTITINFNQPVSSTNRPQGGEVCARNIGDRIYISPDDGNCSNTESGVSLLWLEPNAAAGTTLNANAAYTADWVWSNGGKTLTLDLETAVDVTVGGCSAEESTTIGCFRVRTDLTVTTPTVIESSATPTASLCTTDNATMDDGICWVYTTGRF